MEGNLGSQEFSGACVNFTLILEWTDHWEGQTELDHMSTGKKVLHSGFTSLCGM